MSGKCLIFVERCLWTWAAAGEGGVYRDEKPSGGKKGDRDDESVEQGVWGQPGMVDVEKWVGIAVGELASEERVEEVGDGIGRPAERRSRLVRWPWR